MLATEATILYRYFDADGVLLYVGITVDGPGRLRSHRSTSPWWSRVASATFERFDTRAEALAAEERAILDERPLFNRTHGNESRVDAAAAERRMRIEERWTARRLHVQARENVVRHETGEAHKAVGQLIAAAIRLHDARAPWFATWRRHTYHKPTDEELSALVDDGVRAWRERR